MIVILFLFILIPVETFGSIRSKRIINGNEVKDFENYKFVAAVLGKYGYNAFSLLCGGSIIHSRFILTSAHCFFIENEKRNIKEDMLLTVAGSQFLNNNRSIPRLFRYVKKLIVHENYTTRNPVNDLALVYLAKEFPINMGLIRLIVLNRGNEFLTGKCEIIGWGTDRKGVRQKDLLSLSIEIIPNYVCFVTYETRPSDKIICGKNKNFGSACCGDYGGPLICDGKLAGIIDSGDFNCSHDITIFIDIAKYGDWIDEMMNTVLQENVVSSSQILVHNLVLNYLLLEWFKL